MSMVLGGSAVRTARPVRAAQSGRTVQSGRAVQSGSAVQADRTVQPGRAVQADRTAQSGRARADRTVQARRGTADGGEPARGAARQPARLRLTRRGRVVVALLALGAALGGGLTATAAWAGGMDKGGVVQHTVAPGETLWGIARGVAEPGQDVRAVVDELRSMNDRDSSGLRAGEVIWIPAPR